MVWHYYFSTKHTHVPSYPIELLFTALPVATLAEGMMQDAWNYFSSGGSSAPVDKVTIFGNNDIRRLSEVSC